ncbi:hypothetical protein IWW37_005423 [Coemansia sp. RSA 2050]|nr:hypothetical protein IWW37_005423 [Coemansia sp. RSA 2050]
MCGYDSDKKKAAKKIDDIDGLRDWMTRTPTAKAASSQETLKYLRYIYQSDYFRQHMELQLDIHTRIDRWEMFKRQQRAIVQICRSLTEGLDHKKTTICVGNAIFNSSSRGRITSPSMSGLVDFLRQDGWYAIMVWEFNTSQACSRCCLELQPGELPYKLCDVGSPVDGHAFYHKPGNSHFVKRCTGCWTIWNRDVNAALKIAYLGMLQYYRPPDPETEWQKAYNKVMKGEEKRAAKKEVSKKTKTAPKKTAPKKTPKEPEEPAPQEIELTINP